jgi:SAM-dependent methyltransferase
LGTEDNYMNEEHRRSSRRVKANQPASLSIADLIDRQLPPAPWAEGDNIPWDEPMFSERMLDEHLSQTHDLASRRAPLIDAHVRFIQEHIPGRRSARILDLGCGPGLYLHRLARLGHHGHGIDFSPASIDHARQVATTENLDCCFEQADLRTTSFGEGFDLVLLIFGQLNVFRRELGRDILRRAHAALVPGGKLILEPQDPNAIRSAADHGTVWSAVQLGLFASTPHLLLHERFWDEPSRTATDRWYVVDAAGAAVRRYAMSTCSYSPGDLMTLLKTVGFENVDSCPSLAAAGGDVSAGLFTLVATR